MPLLDGPSLGGNARHVLRQYAEENALARGRAANAAGTEEFGGGCLRGRYNNLREVIQNNPSLVVVPSIINAGSLFVQRPICRTNYLPNNSMAGATGGVLPTNWSIGSLPAGITVSYSASGTAVAADGTSVNYIDVTVSGTAGASGFLNIRPNAPPSTIASVSGQSWNTSVYLQLISGSVASISPTWQLQELNSSQVFLQGSNITGLGSLVVGGQFDRYNVSRVLTDSATAFVTCRWGHSFVSGTTYSYTLRIGSPQLERFSVPTPMIATSTGAVTRLNESTNVVGLPPDFTVSRNTTATRVNSSGLIASVASGVPRIDWLGQSCPGLLVEASGQNLAFHSESWVSGNNWQLSEGSGRVTVVSATSGTLAPDGLSTANAISPTSGNITHYFYSNSGIAVNYVSGTVFTISAFFKKGAGDSGRYIQLTTANSRFIGNPYANFDLELGTTLTVSGSVADSNRASRIQNFGNGWYRCSLTATCNNSTPIANGVVAALLIADTNARLGAAFAGNTNDYIFGWGAQLETGSIATTYIPTTSGAVSRAADVISASGALVSGLIGQTEGTIYAEVDVRSFAASAARRIVNIRVDGNNLLSLEMSIAGNSFDFVATSGGVGVTATASGITTGIYKIAVGYNSAASGTVLYVNGVLRDTKTIAIPNLSAAVFGLGTRADGAVGSQLNDRIRAAALYTTRLSNAQLANLTALT